MTEPIVNKVLLVGWDAADWNVIHPLMDEGKMPHLESLVDHGVMGNLATLYPELSPMLWTSIATGKRAFKHGIYGFTEPDRSGRDVQPVTNLSRKTKALWNILSQEGRKCNIIGWWPSHPAEPINGVMVSNHYQRAHTPLNAPWPMVPGAVHPKRLIRSLAPLRWHPQQLDEGHILPFVPNAALVDQEKDQRLATIARIICDCSTVQAATLAVMHHEPWDLTAVYFDAIDHFSHGFMRYHPPRLDWVSKRDYEIYNRVVESAYVYHDMMLGRLMETAGKDAVVILVSDHGFHSDHRRPKYVPIEPAGPAIEHRRHGIFAMKGPGIKKDEILYGAGLLDICPTVLTLFGLPVGRDMDGIPLVAAFEETPHIDAIPSWDLKAGNAGLHASEKRLDPMESRAAVQQLVELGYIEAPADDREKAVRETVRELDYNLSRTYMDAQRHVDALGILEKLSLDWPGDDRFSLGRAACLQALDRLGEARRVVEAAIVRRKEEAAGAREALQNRFREPSPEDPPTKTERRQWRKLRQRAAYNPAAMEYMTGALHLAEGDATASLTHLFRAERGGLRSPDLYLRMGDAYLQLKELTRCRDAFDKARALDPENPAAHLGLCRFFLATGQNSDAADQALKAASLSYHTPMAHFLLGVALHRLGRIEGAIQALQVAVSQNHNFTDAYRRLAHIHEKRLHDHGKALIYRKRARDAVLRLKSLKKPNFSTDSGAPLTPPASTGATGPGGASDFRIQDPFDPANLARTVVVVSGLPRSGTSMMMQMLKAGGLRVMFDDIRKKDADNPEGYFELEKTKRLHKNNHWLEKANGRAVKVVAQLLEHLNRNCSYRIIYMERLVEEVVASQEKMLNRRGKSGAPVSKEQLIHIFERQEKQIKAMLESRKYPVLSISYHRCIENPGRVARKVNRFLGESLDADAMAAAVRPELYRNRCHNGFHP